MLYHWKGESLLISLAQMLAVDGRGLGGPKGEFMKAHASAAAPCPGTVNEL